MNISIATESTIEALCDLLNLLFTQEADFVSDREKQRMGLKEIIVHPEIGEIFILKKDDTIVGMVSLLYSISTALGGRVATLEDMILHPNHRSQGAGTFLLAHAIGHAKEVQCKRITLLTDKDNEEAINFYKKQGFVTSGMIPLRLVF
ncbi:MAG TPA: GNAT family N-acetyltransferase [Cytophaga sp.]|jgi:ribosomal protein S18 acetylase RimI-like enzyme|nr:GNAT family N-acetyltransferase [Cytophaga sp.]